MPGKSTLGLTDWIEAIAALGTWAAAAVALWLGLRADRARLSLTLDTHGAMFFILVSNVGRRRATLKGVTWRMPWPPFRGKELDVLPAQWNQEQRKPKRIPLSDGEEVEFNLYASKICDVVRSNAPKSARWLPWLVAHDGRIVIRTSQRTAVSSRLPPQIRKHLSNQLRQSKQSESDAPK